MSTLVSTVLVGFPKHEKLSNKRMRAVYTFSSLLGRRRRQTLIRRFAAEMVYCEGNVLVDVLFTFYITYTDYILLQISNKIISLLCYLSTYVSK
jgi:hypothetical protein